MPSLAGVTAWRADDLPVGAFIARPVEVEPDASSKGNPQAVVDWRVLAGNFTGAEKRDYITFTESAMGRVVQVIEACGQEVPQEDFASYEALRDWVVEMLKKGPIVEMICREESYTVPPEKRRGPDDDGNRTGVKIKGYRRPNSLDVPADLSDFGGGVNVNGATCKHAGCDEDAVEKGYCAAHKVPF